MKFFVLAGAILLFMNSSFAQNSCKAPRLPSEYKKLKEQLDQRVRNFANGKTIASGADGTLSKLLKANSPIIHKWMVKRDLLGKSEERIVRAWREYYAKNFILSKYPHKIANVDKAVESLVNATISSYSTQANQLRFEKLFLKAQTRAMAYVKKLKIGAKNKRQINKRLAAVKLYWPESLQSARNNAVPLDIVSWTVAYDPVPNEINMGLEALAYANDETILAVFTHELGHAIDSCRWGAFLSGEWPFAKVGRCLRTAKSVGAMKRDDSFLESLVHGKKISSQLAASLRAHPTCNKREYPTAGLQKDQLAEAFADWFSAEVMADMLNSIDTLKMRTDLCHEKTLTDGSSYPTNKLRLEKIYWAQPKIARRLGRIKSKAYCAF